MAGFPIRPGPRREAGAPRGPLARAAVLALAACLWGVPDPAGAAIVEVTRCTDTTPVSLPGELRAAIQSAGVDDVILLPPCRITLTGAAGEDANAGGDVDVPGRILTLQGAGVGRTILDGNGLDRPLDILGSIVTVADLTLTNGAGPGPGGGLRIAGSIVTLARIAVTDSEVPPGTTGGGLDLAGSIVTVVDSAATGNRAPAGGGLATAGSIVTVDETTVSGNRVSVGLDGEGGGILIVGSIVVLRQVTVSGNRAEDPAAAGGGLRVIDSLADGLMMTIADNAAAGAMTTGGGLFGSGSIMVLRGSIVAGNSPENCAGPTLPASADGNLQDDASCPFAEAGDQTVGAALLGPLGDHGGLVPTRLPLPGSPALDRGPAAGCPGLDAREVSRPRDGDGDGLAACDVGAAERRVATPARAGDVGKVTDPR